MVVVQWKMIEHGVRIFIKNKNKPLISDAQQEHRILFKPAQYETETILLT